MNKKLIALSAIAAITTTSFASTDLETRLNEMEKKILLLEQKLTDANQKLNNKLTQENQKLTKQLSKVNSKINKVKTHDANDNIKWDVEFRTAMDSIHYKHASGAKSSNPDLLTNRLWLGMAFAPSDNVLFKGKLSYNKAYGDTANHSQSNTAPGYADFDWVTNENATDNTLKVKEAYWLYKNDTFFDTNVPWTISIGRRPSTDGLGINMREGMKENSPLSHTINVEFDGLSSKFNLDKVTGVDGMWWKLCTGRGLTNAKPRFSNDGADYAYDDTKNKDINMYGFIFVPWDNGQYSVHTNWARAENLIGFNKADMLTYGGTVQTYTTTPNVTNYNNMVYNSPQFKSVGDMDLFTTMFKAEGLGDGISDFLDNTRVFASWAQSKTRPKGSMLGSTSSQTGHSTWIGINIPALVTDDGRFGIEWNKGSKNWRSVTYGEDTMAGSKIAARGTAWEIYYDQPLTKSLKFNARYTQIKYDYTGSNAFFGDDGVAYAINTPSATLQANGLYGDPVMEASD
ncbi:MAG: DUF3373 family protein, partial [Arcobacteraceae bacterium]